MTNEEKKELLEKEIDELFSKKFAKEEKLWFNSELDSIKWSHKELNKIITHYNKRIKELGITDLKEKEIYDVE